MMAKKQGIKALTKQWYDILKKDGFVDIEVGKPFRPNIRTKAFTDREYVLEYFLKVDFYLTHNKDISQLHRQILELYSNGAKHKEIANKVDKSVSRVRQIITEYKSRISTFALI